MKKSRTDPLHFHLWIPELFQGEGGIQVFSGFFIQAIQNIYPQAKYSIFIKNDHPDRIPQKSFILPNTPTYGFGNWQGIVRTVLFSAFLILKGILERPSLVITTHLHFTPAARLLKRLTGIPYWTIAHGVEAWDIKEPRLQKALQSADQILAVSNYTRDRILKEQNIAPEQVSILPNTFDASKLSIQPKPQYLLARYHLQPDQPIILTVARLASGDRYKGYDQIIRSLPTIRHQIPNIHYLLVGKGADHDRIEAIIDDMNVRDCVTLAGFVPDNELADHYNLCNVFAMPSKAEGFGIVYLESLACGKPTIGGNQDGAIDALSNGELGVLVSPDNIEEIGETIVKILESRYPLPILYQPEAIRQKVIELYGFDEFKYILSALVRDKFLLCYEP